jgi:hypothetical protein
MINPLDSIGLTGMEMLWPSLVRVLFEYFSLAWHELVEFAGHYIIVVPSLLLASFSTWGWLTKSWGKVDFLREAMRRQVVPLALVLAIFVLSKYNTLHEVREQKAREARTLVDRSFSATETQLEATSISEPGTRLVLLSQGMGEIATRTFDLVRDSYPEFDLRTVSVFLDVGQGKIEDVIREGELEKDRRYFGRSTSMAGSAIETGIRQYCPDLSVRKHDQKCQHFEEPRPGAPLEFVSLLCYPVTLNDELFAAFCLDSKTPRAFDRKEDETWESIRYEVQRLATLLHTFRRVREDSMISSTVLSTKVVKNANGGQIRPVKRVTPAKERPTISLPGPTSQP